MAASGYGWYAMAGRFSFSSPGSRYSSDPWFRVGEVDVTTTVLVAATCVLSMFVWAADADALAALVLQPAEIRGGQIWRLVTWPLANAPDIWTLLTIAIFWYFGRDIEGMLGRNRFATFLAVLTVTPAIIATLADFDVAPLVRGESGPITFLELGVFLTFIIEFPQVRFFFGIPGWVIGAIIIGIQVLQFVGWRYFDGLLFLFVVLATAALAARSMGLAASLHWLPKIPLPGSGSGGRSGSTGGSRRSRAQKRSSRGATVVEGPWHGRAGASAADDAAAQAELDALLDKISAGGLDSLTGDEKRRLNELSKRLR